MDKIQKTSFRASRQGRSLSSEPAVNELHQFQKMMIDETRYTQEKRTKISFELLILAIMLLGMAFQVTTRVSFETTLLFLAVIPAAFCQLYIGFILLSSVRLHHFDVELIGVNGINSLRVPSKLVEDDLAPVVSVSALCHCVGSTSYYVLSMSVMAHFCFACAAILYALHMQQCWTETAIAMLVLASEFGMLLIGTVPVQKELTYSTAMHLSGVTLAESCSIIAHLYLNYGNYEIWPFLVVSALIGTGATFAVKQIRLEATTFKEMIDVHISSREVITWEWLNVTLLGIVMLSNASHLFGDLCS